MKKFILILFSLLLLFQITGCNNNNVVDDTTNDTDEYVEVIMPEKGQDISIDNNEFKVIKIDGSEAILLLNESYKDVTFGENDIYENSNVDKECEKFYNSLPEDMKNAIIEKDINIYEYEVGVLEINEANGRSPAGYSYESKNLLTTIRRHAYVLDPEDIEEYLSGNFTSDTLKEMFNNREFDFPWLRSRDAGNPYNGIWGINSQSGEIMSYGLENTSAVRPAFVIDLNKIKFSIIK